MAEKIDIKDLKRKSLRGGSVTVISQGISFVINLGSTILLARLLSPLEFGAVAMVTALTGFAGLFRDLGLSAAAVQKKDLSNAQQSNLFWLNVAMGLILTLVVAAASPLVGMFYGRPELTLLCLVTSLNFLIGSLTAQHSASMIRNMQFGRNATAMIGGNAVGLIVTILMALKGMSYWSLVWGGMVGGFCTSLMMVCLSPLHIVRPQRGTHIKNMLRFGANVTAFDFVNYFARNSDNILIGRFVGADALGLYTRAYRLLMFPINSIRGPINAVVFPALSKLQDEPELFKSFASKSAFLIAFLSMPLCAFFFIAGDLIVTVLLGSQWSEAGILVKILSIAAILQPVCGIRGMVMLSSGYSKRYMKAGMLNSVIVVIGFCIGVYWGAVGAATAYAAINLAIFPFMTFFTLRGTKYPPTSLYKDIGRPLTLAVLASVATAGCRGLLQNLSEPLQLASMCGLFGVFTIVFLFPVISKNQQNVLLKATNGWR